MIRAAAMWMTALGGGALLVVVTSEGGALSRSRAAQSGGAARGCLDAECRMVDLTHAFDERTIYWPTEIPFRLERGFAGITAGGWYYSANRFSMAEHSGTHVDAPIHFAKGGHSVDEISLRHLIGPGVVVDVSKECEADPDFLVTVDVLTA